MIIRINSRLTEQRFILFLCPSSSIRYPGLLSETLHWIFKVRVSAGENNREINSTFPESDQDLKALVLHPLRTQANGRPVYTTYLALWGDDVSGNKSKQWNVHWNWYFVNAGCPKELLTQEYFMKFASTSPYATNLEQAEAIVSQVLCVSPIITSDSCHPPGSLKCALGKHGLTQLSPGIARHRKKWCSFCAFISYQQTIQCSQP